MSLRRKILFKDMLLFVSLLMMVAGSMFGLWKQREHVQGSLYEYTALHRVEVAAARLRSYQQAVRSGSLNQPAAFAELRAALTAMSEYKALVSQYGNSLPPEITPDLQMLAKTKSKAIVTRLAQLTLQVEPPRSSALAHPSNTTPPDPVVILAAIDQLSGELTDLLETCNGFVYRTQVQSDQDLHRTTVGVASIAGCMLLLAVLASSWQYRKTVVPLQRLRQWCRRAASGDFSVPYQPTSDREFQELGRDVNKMADELNAFYRRLESMVALKSRELVRSERLASVGYLAAGVAHEINNPLNIMSGYAELSLKRLRRLSPDSGDSEIAKHLAIIRSEAFRCKEITRKLLSLAKGNGDERETISLADAVSDVSSLVHGLKTFRGKKLDVAIDPQERLLVLANLTEIKQVLLNLIVNALEAVEPGNGAVTVEGSQAFNWIELNISDNGRGMTEETIERVFEPFFTNKRGAGEPGSGLGLSITHAIVTHHGGDILAHSDGPNHGSRFTIRLPSVEMIQTPLVSQEARPAEERLV